MRLLRPLLWLAAFVPIACHAEAPIEVSVRAVGETLVVDAVIEAPVDNQTAWTVLTDFDHMAGILTNLTSSKVLRRDGNTWLVRQEGTARAGPFSYDFWAEREVRLEPMTRILAKNIAGIPEHAESQLRIVALPQASAVRLEYHAETVPDSFLVRTFGPLLLRHEVAEQFGLMVNEMKRRSPAAGLRPESPAP